MSEEENTEQSPEDRKTESLEETLLNNTSADENILSEETIVETEIKNMEVHHHPHVEKKNFKEYFLEFLMIFLAVTMGFFAESLREHIGDRSKENEYISSLKNDLIADTVNLRIWMQAFNSRINEYDTLINLLKHPETITDGSDLYYRARVTTRGTVFDDNNPTIVQLNISGNFRLISNKSIADKIVIYENDIDNYKNVNSYDAYEARALYEPESKLFDAFVFNDMSKPITDSSVSSTNSLLTGFRNVFRKPEGNPQMLTHDKEKINDFVYYLHQRRSTFAAEILILYKQKTDAAELINIVNKEYNLENE